MSWTSILVVSVRAGLGKLYDELDEPEGPGFNGVASSPWSPISCRLPYTQTLFDLDAPMKLYDIVSDNKLVEFVVRSLALLRG
jgi:hypothetical protein